MSSQFAYYIHIQYNILYAYAENKNSQPVMHLHLRTAYFTKFMYNYKIYTQVHKIIYFSENIYVGKDHLL